MSVSELYKLVWQWREENAWFPIPDPIDSIRYAVTEAGEAVDADLRARRTKDLRNNDRVEDPLDELADAAIMVISACPMDEDVQSALDVMDGLDTLSKDMLNIDIIACIVFDAYMHFCGWHRSIHDALMIRAMLAVKHINIFVPDLSRRMEARLERIKVKNGK